LKTKWPIVPEVPRTILHWCKHSCRCQFASVEATSRDKIALMYVRGTTALEINWATDHGTPHYQSCSSSAQASGSVDIHSSTFATWKFTSNMRAGDTLRGKQPEQQLPHCHCAAGVIRPSSCAVGAIRLPSAPMRSATCRKQTM